MSDEKPFPQITHRPCEPPISEVQFGEVQDAGVAARLAVLYGDDQTVRSGGEIDWMGEEARGRARRREIMAYLAQGQIVSPECLFHAAMIFQHGNCPEHFQLCTRLAERAMHGGHKTAAWLYAASIDRYLMHTGKPQKYGTQYFAMGNEKPVLWDVDPATTDEERQRYGVPPLDEAIRHAKEMKSK